MLITDPKMHTNPRYSKPNRVAALETGKALADGRDDAGDRDARLLALCASHHTLESEISVLSLSLDEERLEALCTKQGRVMKEVVLTPALTVVGVAAKLDLWHQTERTYLDDNDLLWDSLADDLSLLSGLAVAKFHPGTSTQELSAASQSSPFPSEGLTS
jgi:hypothetical protein